MIVFHLGEICIRSISIIHDPRFDSKDLSAGIEAQPVSIRVRNIIAYDRTSYFDQMFRFEIQLTGYDISSIFWDEMCLFWNPVNRRKCGVQN